MKVLQGDRDREEEAWNAKLTNKQEHMRKFKEQHLKTTVGKMYTKNAQTQDSFYATGGSRKGR